MILEERNEESRKHFYVPFRCDKKVDCHDKSDEQNCNYRQQHDEVKRNANEQKKTHIMPIRTTSARLTEGKTGCSSRRRRSATVTTTAGTSLMRKAARGCLVR